MTARTWVGGGFLDASSWSPAGAPQPGDVLTIGVNSYGYAEAPQLVGLDVRFTTTASDPGRLGFNNAVVGSSAPAGSTRLIAGPGGAGLVHFYGATSLVGSSSLVASGAGSELTIGIGKDLGNFYAPPGVLTNSSTNGFRAEAGGALTLGDPAIPGGAGTIVNDGVATVTGEGSYLLLNTEVTGTGWIDVAAGGQLDVNDHVGAGQTVRFAGTGNTVLLYVPQSFEAALSNMVRGNALWLLQPGSDYIADSVRYASGVLDVLLNGELVTSIRLDLPAATGFSVSRFESGGYAVVSVTSNAVVCFAAGTRILTAAGEVPVESLRPGDRVATLRRAGLAAVVWLGRRTVDLRLRPDARPIRIEPGAFGPGLPHRTLRVSPEHGLLLDGALIPARLLVNGGSVRIEACAHVTYWHIELARHDVLLADGMPAESWLDCGNRVMFDNAPTGAPARPGPTEPCAPRLLGGPVLLALHARFAPQPALAA